MSSLHPRPSLLMFPKDSQYMWGKFFQLILVPLVASSLYCHLQSHSWTLLRSSGSVLCTWMVSGLRLLGPQRSPICTAVGSNAELLGVCLPNISPTHCRHHAAVNVRQHDSDFDKQGVTGFFLLCHKVFFIWEEWSFCQVHLTAVCLPGALNQVEDLRHFRLSNQEWDIWCGIFKAFTS